MCSSPTTFNIINYFLQIYKNSLSLSLKESEISKPFLASLVPFFSIKERNACTASANKDERNE